MMIYGRNVVKEALDAGVHLSRVHILDSNSLSQEMRSLEARLRAMNVKIERVDGRKLEAISHSKDHQGIVAHMKRYEYVNTWEILNNVSHDPFVLILDRVQDPHNFGAIIRSAYGAGAHLIVIPEKSGCSVTPAVLKTSAGYAFRMPIAMEVNLARTVERLKKMGIWVYAAVMDGKPYDKLDMSGPLALIVGNEGNGVRRLLVEKSDECVSIPMARKMDSLNVSVSTAVLAFHVMEVRRSGGDKTSG